MLLFVRTYYIIYYQECFEKYTNIYKLKIINDTKLQT